jgi:hypothetical protein
MAVIVLSGSFAVPAASQPGRSSWAETKCIRYTAAWNELKKVRGLAGLGDEFVKRHTAFMELGCRASTHVCPRSASELEVANMMVVAALNGGMASTFPPFSCKQ